MMRSSEERVDDEITTLEKAESVVTSSRFEDVTLTLHFTQPENPTQSHRPTPGTEYLPSPPQHINFI